MDADRNNVELMNNLAWLCARCGERIERMDFAQAAEGPDFLAAAQ